MISVIQVVATAAAALILICGAVQRTEWRGGLLSVAFVFLAAAADFCEPMWEAFLPDWFDEPELVPIVIALVAATCAAAIYKRTTLPGLRAIAKNRRFPILVWGLLCVSILPNVAQNKYLWSFAVTEKESTHNVRETASDAVGFFGAALLLNWAVLFAKDKRKMLRHRPSAHEHLIRQNELVPIGLFFFFFFLGSSRSDSNGRPAHYECAALPTEPRKQVIRDVFASTCTIIHKAGTLSTEFITENFYAGSLRKPADEDALPYAVPSGKRLC